MLKVDLAIHYSLENPSAKFAKVAYNVLRFGTSLMNYKSPWWRLNTLQCTPT